MYATSSSTFLNFPCSSQTFCSTFATFSSRTFSVNSILFFKSFISSRSFPVSSFVITRLFSIIFYICCCCFANSSSKTVFISSTILSLSIAVFPLAVFFPFEVIFINIIVSFSFLCKTCPPLTTFEFRKKKKKKKKSFPCKTQ